jgi:hypothetical protein
MTTHCGKTRGRLTFGAAPVPLAGKTRHGEDVRLASPATETEDWTTRSHGDTLELLQVEHASKSARFIVDTARPAGATSDRLNL